MAPARIASTASSGLALAVSIRIGRPGSAVLEFLDQLAGIVAGHPLVEDDRRKLHALARAERGDRGLAIADHQRAPAFARGERGDQPALRRFVVDQHQQAVVAVDHVPCVPSRYEAFPYGTASKGALKPPDSVACGVERARASAIGAPRTGITFEGNIEHGHRQRHEGARRALTAASSTCSNMRCRRSRCSR